MQETLFPQCKMVRLGGRGNVRAPPGCDPLSFAGQKQEIIELVSGGDFSEESMVWQHGSSEGCAEGQEMTLAAQEAVRADRGSGQPCRHHCHQHCHEHCHQSSARSSGRREAKQPESKRWRVHG